MAFRCKIDGPPHQYTRGRHETSHRTDTGIWFAGITRLESNGSTLRNVANRNGTIGIVTSDSHGLILGNVINRNAGHGPFVYETFLDHGRFRTVTGNTANRNGGYGIATNLVGVIDGGGNRARHNGDPLECQGIVCA